MHIADNVLKSNFSALHSQGRLSVCFEVRCFSGRDLEEDKYAAELTLLAEVFKLTSGGKKYFIESRGWQSRQLSERSQLWQLEYRVILAEPNRAEIGDITYIPAQGKRLRLRDRVFENKAENVWLRVS